LFDALDEAHRGQLTPTTVEALRREYGLPQDDAE
jgi:hypothetical protein